MDWIFVYLFAVWSVINLTPTIIGVEASETIKDGLAFSPGEPSSVIAQKNGELVLNCSVLHDVDVGDLVLNWTKDGSPIELDKRVRVLDNGSLYIKRIVHRPNKHRTDAGRYKCTATLIKGSELIGRVIVRNISVQVSGIERNFDIEPQPQTVPVGGAVRFLCQISAVPPASYMWERNKTSLPQNDHRYLELKNSGILQITGVTENDAGLYRCYATQGKLHELPGDDIDVKYSEEAALTVFKGTSVSQPRIVASSKNVTAVIQTSALLECLVEGFSGHVIWRHNDQRVNVENSGRLELVGNNLRFVETELADDGKYECVAGNMITIMNLNIIKKPVITEMTPSKRYQRSQWIYLECKADGHPKPTITWLKNGEPVDVSDSTNYRILPPWKLAIVISQPSYAGYYQCLAGNDAGTMTAFTRVEILVKTDVPGMPKNMTAVHVTSNSILVTWAPAVSKEGFPVVAYTVHFRKDGSKSEEAVTILTEMLLQGLSPFSDYIVYVAAFSKVGQGPFSEQLKVKTLEDVLSRPPVVTYKCDSFKLASSMPSRPPVVTLEPRLSSILVKWEPLREVDRNGIIVEYKVFIREKGDDDVRAELVNGSATSYLVKGLRAEKSYEVRMLAATSVGYKDNFLENEWPWIEVKTLADSYVQPPDMSITQLDTTAINVTWEFTEKVRSFKVMLKSLPAGQVIKSAEVFPSQSKSVVFTQLDDSFIYEITVTAETLDGQFVDATEEYSPRSVPKPPAPENVRVTMTKSDSLVIEWEYLSSSIEVLSFTVRYRQMNGGSYHSLTSESNMAVLENLTPDSQYEISVRANTEKLPSSYSSAIYHSTSSEGTGVPSAPESVKIQIVKPGNVGINWKPPAQPNGNIKSYTILYTTTPSNADELWVKVEKSGLENSALITIADTSGATYYFKLHANTDKGPGLSTKPLPVNPMAPDTGELIDETTKKDQTLGIVIGVGIGVFFIITCTIIIICLYRCYGRNNSREPSTIPARYHGNGHIPSNGNGHAVQVVDNQQMVGGVYEMEAYTPMLQNLPENEHSDSKGGGGSNVILTPNGAKLNGFISFKQNGLKNGQITNGHAPLNQFLHDSEETRDLIAAMLVGDHEQCMTADVGEDSFTRSRFEDLGSLDNIDTGSSEDGFHKTCGKSSSGSGRNSAEDSGEGSLTASEHTSSDSGRNSVHRLERTDTGDTAVFCGGSVPRGMSSSSRSTNTGVVAGSGRADLPVYIPQASPSCEDTILHGGTFHPPASALNVQESVSGLILPHDVNMMHSPGTSPAVHASYLPTTIATSAPYSQANRLTDNMSSASSSGVEGDHTGILPQDLYNGSPLDGSAKSRRHRHPAASNGVPPQLHPSGTVSGYPERINCVLPHINNENHTSVSFGPQGHLNGLSLAENNPSQNWQDASILVDSMNGHIAQLPQENRVCSTQAAGEVRSTSVKKSPRLQNHVHV